MNETIYNCNLKNIIKELMVRINELDGKGFIIKTEEVDLIMADGVCYPCGDKSLSNCIAQIKAMNADCPCPVKNVIKDLLERVEALESA